VVPDEPEYLYLTTTGRWTGRPREIEIWFTTRDDRYYIVAEHGETSSWVRNIRHDARVTFRVGNRTFAGRARVVDAPSERELAADVRRRSARKYGWGDGLVVELTSVE
jgi:deazaflavin-dependent oxidoreductase (nitroreductase family)